MTHRTYSTREIAQMWNVSESTVKRWADSSGLKCKRTPGGHRRFHLEDIYEFQQKRAFEATGLLATDEWEDPELEVWLNSRKFSKVCDLLLYLCGENQRSKVSCLLERLYLRGMRLDEIFDDVVAPLEGLIRRSLEEGNLNRGQSLFVKVNLEDSISDVSSRMICKRQNGKTALSASPSRFARISVNVASKLLEIEGWETLNLGEDVSFEAMSEVVETEPVNLVCLVATTDCPEESNGFDRLLEISQSYRIPVLLTTIGEAAQPNPPPLPVDEHFVDFGSFRRYVARLST